MTWRTRVAFAMIAVAACGRSEELEADALAWKSRWEDSARTVAQAISRGMQHTACSTRAAPMDGTWLVVSAEQCLTCRDIGWLMRRLRESATADAPVQVATAATDTAVVCKYLESERVQLPVFIYREAPSLAQDAPIMAIVLANGSPTHVVAAVDGMALASELAEFGAVARQMSPPDKPEE